MKDPNYLITKYKQNFHNKISLANITLNNYIKDGYLDKYNFFIDCKEDNIKYLVYAFILIFTYYSKLSYTAIAIEIGRSLLYLTMTIRKEKK
jgi:hypothetical protein